MRSGCCNCLIFTHVAVLGQPEFSWIDRGNHFKGVLCEDCRSASVDSNPGPPKCESYLLVVFPLA